MLTLAQKLRPAAAAIFMLGLSCMPLPIMSPKTALSAFGALPTTGWFIGLGVGAMVVAAAVFLASFALRRRQRRRRGLRHPQANAEFLIAGFFRRTSA